MIQVYLSNLHCDEETDEVGADESPRTPKWKSRVDASSRPADAQSPAQKEQSMKNPRILQLHCTRQRNTP